MLSCILFFWQLQKGSLLPQGMQIGFCQCNVFLDVFRRPGGKDSVLHFMEATGSLLCQLFAGFCQADILILRA